MHESRRGESDKLGSLSARQAAALAAFNRAWQMSEQPRLIEFAPAIGELPLLIAMIRLDLQRRLEAGEEVRVESYLEQWPALAEDSEATLDLAVAEAAARSRAEPGVQLDEYLRRFPQFAAALPAALQFADGAHPSGDGSQTDVDRSLSDTADVESGLGATKSHHATGEAEAIAATRLPQLPGYEVIRRIARGGMGEVLEARHRILNRTVAIKVPLPHLISGDADRERFLREARSAAQLRHPHICAIHEIGQNGGCPYIIMDFVRGQTLKQWRESCEPSARQAAEMVAPLARAVAYAHEHGVIHRDLKPSNVLVEAESGAPVLTDFGLAKRLDDKSSQLTHSGQVMGTPAYMAPEQAAGRVDQVGPLSDVYSLGAVLYELLCGRPPFAGNLGEVLRQVQTDEPPSPRAINPRVHRDMETVCLKALAKDPAARYPSAADLAEDLERFGAGEPILARRRSPLQRLGRQLRRRPAMAATLVAVAATLVLAVGLAVKTGGNLEITRLNQAFEAGLDQSEWTGEHLDRMEDVVAKLAAFSPTASRDARTRLYQRYADVHRALLRKATLEAEDAERVEQALAVLQDRAAALAPALRQAFAERKSGWDAVVALERETPPDQVFAAGTVVRQGERFVRQRDAEPPQLARRVYALTACQGKVELDALFDESWRNVAELGLILNALPKPAAGAAPAAAGSTGGDTGYLFRLSATVRKVVDENAAARANPASFSRAAIEDGEFVLEILRGGTRLARQTIKASQVASGPLRLFAGRHANRLSMQVNDLPPLVFEDVFPLGRNRPGVFALLWPSEVGLLQLSGRRQAMPPAASLLERGDEAYDRGALAEALQAYREEAVASVGAGAAQEARYKEAACLAALERPEARQHLEKLAAEPGDRWPVLAACELWLSNMRSRRFDEADAIFEALSGRYSFQQLAALTPSELREEIMAAYGQQATGVRLYSYDPKRIEHLRRAVEIETLLGASDYPSYGSRWHLLRALHAGGRLDEALDFADSMVGENGPWRDELAAANWIEEEAWLLCLQGRAEQALQLVDRLLFEQPGKYRTACGWLLLARARTLTALGRWDDAEHDIEEMFRLFPPETEACDLTAPCLVRGLLRERRGDELGAIEAWKAGFAPEKAVSQPGSAFLANLIQASLSGEATDQQADKLTTHLIASFAGDSPISALKEAFRLPPAVVRQMWCTPRGRDVARQIAFREVALPECMRLPALVVATETVHQSAFGNQWTEEQEELIWNLTADGYALQGAGRLSAAQTLSLAMTWKGMTNFLGWGGLAPGLEPRFRAGLAYLFAHRYLALNKRDDALRFLQTAISDSVPDSAVYRLASQEAMELGSN